ncbi:nucleoside hydrolase [Nocardia macrotermitis]|uniref:Pyrimidine-specific ribonucleoside hydrolase RihA n=1 Tax=Nocardia macrotermitis TaxID=2585198 RepID=A0A7K0DCW7_9NOCA|nr:nucleoside hydrolase [Nocardia macrotermitis]MQY22734.1 Pyrimidine-specific ribonucleoside hydrolase RihA [Nocardia macrotermitis]
MGDYDDSDETLESASAAMLEFATRYPEFSALADKLRAAGPPPPRVQGTPIILDTDVGGDPDDAIALACAARRPELALVLTADENRGQRAQFARYLLDLLGRNDVRVVAGADLGNTRYWVVDGLTPATIGPQSDDVLRAVVEVCAATQGPVRWVGCGPLTNLAHVLRTVPDLAERLVVTQMGGAINYRDPSRAEHNFRLDADAARYVVATVPELTLVLSDVTFTEEMEIHADSEVYKTLSAPDAPVWARLLGTHLDRWFTLRHPATKQHDPLTLTVALDLPFVDLSRPTITVAGDARMSTDPDGHPTWVTIDANYPAFWRWLTTQLAI